MEKSRERKCLEKLMEMMYKDKTVTIESDFSHPYTLIITNEDGTGEHTHSSYYPGAPGSTRKEDIKGCTDSFIAHILQDKPGLSFA